MASNLETTVAKASVGVTAKSDVTTLLAGKGVNPSAAAITTNRSGARSLRPGDMAFCTSLNKCVRVDDFVVDGSCFITSDVSVFNTVRWDDLAPI